MQVQTFSCGSWQTYFRQASGTHAPTFLARCRRSLWALLPDTLACSNAFAHATSPSPGLDGGPLGARPLHKLPRRLDLALSWPRKQSATLARSIIALS